MRTRNPKVGNTVEALLRISTVADAGRDFALQVCAEESDGYTVGNNAQKSRYFHAEQPEEHYSHDRRPG